MKPHEQIPLDDIYAAQKRLDGKVIRTPLVRLNSDDTPNEIYLKLESLQPVNSFKLRGASNAMLLASKEQLSHGVYTASAGNAAQGVAWNARRLGIACTIVVPEHAPQTKLDAITRLGAEIVSVPYDQWWQVRVDHGYEPLEDWLTSTRPATLRSWLATARSDWRSWKTCRTWTPSSSPGGAAG
jgi:threonine dehydratase